VILENVFSVDGCRQIVVDVERGINAIFEPFLSSTKKPETFDELREVCKLLTLKQASAILLLESLKSGDTSAKDKSTKDKSKPDAKKILAEFDVQFLSAEQSVKILKRRIDLQ
jgi:hypothetical protein